MTNMNTNLYMALSQIASINSDDGFNSTLTQFDHLNRHNQLAKYLMGKMDRNHDGRVSAKELRKFVSRLMDELKRMEGSQNKNDWFDCADKNDDGCLSKSELKDFLKKMAGNCAPKPACKIKDPCKPDFDPCKPKQAYCPPAVSAMERGLDDMMAYCAPDKYDMMRAADSFDKNADGKFARDEYESMMNGFGLDDKTTQDGLWKTADADKSGSLESAEMSAFYKKLLGADDRYTDRDAMRLMLSENLAAMQAAVKSTQA